MVDRNKSEPPPKKRKLSVFNDGDDIEDEGNTTSNNKPNANIHKSFTNTNKLSHLGTCNLLDDDQEILDIVSIRNELNELCNTEDGQFKLLSLYHNHMKQYALGCNNIGYN